MRPDKELAIQRIIALAKKLEEAEPLISRFCDVHIDEMDRTLGKTDLRHLRLIEKLLTASTEKMSEFLDCFDAVYLHLESSHRSMPRDDLDGQEEDRPQIVIEKDNDSEPDESGSDEADEE